MSLMEPDNAIIKKIVFTPRYKMTLLINFESSRGEQAAVISALTETNRIKILGDLMILLNVSDHLALINKPCRVYRNEVDDIIAIGHFFNDKKVFLRENL